MHLQRGLGHMAKQAAQVAGAAHAVPLVAQASGGQRKRVAGLGRLRHRLVGFGNEAGASVVGGEDAVFVQACLADGLAFWQRPLLGRSLQHGVAHAGDVQVAAAGGFAVLVPEGFRCCVGEQRGAAALQCFDPPRHIHHDLPVVPRRASARDRCPHPADAPLAVGDRALFLAPGGGG